VKIFEEVWNEFIIAFCESLKIDKLCKWLEDKLKK